MIYLTVTMPDITFIASVLSRFMYQPRGLLIVALRILDYIEDCSGKGLLYKKYEHVRIFEYSDLGYVGDREDRKFTTGYCTFVGENLVT